MQKLKFSFGKNRRRCRWHLRLFISLKDFLSRHRAEVKDLFLTEYDEKLHERTLREEGEFKKACEMAAAMLMDGMPPNKVNDRIRTSWLNLE